MSPLPRPPVVIVDVGLGNLRSVARALSAALDVPAESFALSGDPGAVREAAVVVFPGQGAFGDCSVALGRDGGALGRAIGDHIEADRPYLGVCLGLQVLFASSDEAPGSGGIGVFGGSVKRLPDGLHDPDGARVKVPHVGWNQVRGRLFEGDPWFYFVHSYRVVPDDASLVAGETGHGVPFVSAVARGRTLGVQFHPEKSQGAGLALLRRFFTEVARWS